MVKRRWRPGSVIAAVGAAALIGIAAFGVVAWRSVAIEIAEPDQALTQFAAIRDRFSGMDPVVRVFEDGVRRRPAPDQQIPPTHLYVLAYRQAQWRLVRAEVPFWFLKVKGPALQYVLEPTGLDLERLGLTPAELQQYGAALVLDETRANGDRLLVWMN